MIFAGSGRCASCEHGRPYKDLFFSDLVKWLATPEQRRGLLTSASYGAAAPLYSQPVGVGWLREIIRAQLGDGNYPQLVFRLGTVIQSAMSVRCPLSSVLAGAGRDPTDPAASYHLVGVSRKLRFADHRVSVGV